MQLTFDADVEAFRAEFVAFLDEHLPDEYEAVQRAQSSSDIPPWARPWQRLLFDHGWLLPGNPAEFGGRDATVLQQYVHAEELSRRRIYRSFNPQGVGIMDLASLRTAAVLDGDHFVVNGQKVWTSGAHDADVLLTFVRTDPDAPKHKGISVLLIPTDSPGLACRPFASVAGRDDLDFN
jgi:alkylation response protein AidB-like acyl-CoA dehydrogenase